MQKIIDNVITVILGFIVGSFFFLAVQAKAEPPNFNQYDYPQQQKQEKYSLNTLPDNAIQMLLEQGVLGLVVLALGFWFVKESKINRIDRNAQMDKYVILSAEISSHLAQNSTRLEGLEREIENQKQISMLTNRKG